jgi:acyl carrier protein
MTIQDLSDDEFHSPSAGLHLSQAGSPGELFTSHDIQEWLISKLHEVQGLNPADIDVKQPLENYGLGSVQAVSLVGDLEDWLGVPLPPTLLWDYPSIEALANHLAEEAY